MAGIRTLFGIGFLFAVGGLCGVGGVTGVGLSSLSAQEGTVQNKTQVGDAPKTAPDVILLKTTREVREYRHRTESIAKVQLKGVVTYCDPNWKFLAIEDETGGLAAFFSPTESPPLPGQRILVEGLLSNTKSDWVMITPCRIRVETNQALPKAINLTVPQLIKGLGNGQRVQVQGRVRDAKINSLHQFQFQLISDQDKIDVYVQLEKARDIQLPDWETAKIEVTGVSHLVPSAEVFQSTRALLVQNLNDLKKLKNNSPQDVPLVSIGELPQKKGSLVRVYGTITELKDNTRIVVKQKDQSVLVECNTPLPGEIGDQVEVVGTVQENNNAYQLVFSQVVAYGLNSIGQTKAAEQIGRDDYSPILRSTADIRRLTEAEARKGYPVRLRGTILYHDRDRYHCFIHDGKEGIFIQGDLPEKMVAGQILDIRGRTNEGLFAPIVQVESYDVLTRGPLPLAHQVYIAQLVGGSEDSQWVQLKGIVQEADLIDPDRVRMEFNLSGRKVDVFIPRAELELSLDRYIGASLTIEGVCASRFDSDRQWREALVLVPSHEQIQIHSYAPKNLFELTPKSISSLTRFNSEQIVGQPIKIAGHIVYRSLGEKPFIYCQDDTGGIKVELAKNQLGEVGDRVEIAGFLREQERSLVMRSGQVHVIARGEGREPISLNSEQDTEIKGYLNQYVRLSGIVSRKFKTEQRVVYYIKTAIGENEDLIPVFLESGGEEPELQEIRVGTHVSVAGILVENKYFDPVTKYSVWSSSPQSIKVLGQTREWGNEQALYVLLGMISILVFAMGTVFYLRRTVRYQTEMIRENYQRESVLEARYRELVENANDIIFTTDTEGLITTFNRAGEMVTGYFREEVIGRSWNDLQTPATEIENKTVLKDGSSIYEMRVQSRSRDVITLEINLRPLYENGVWIGNDGIARDITQRKRSEQELRRAYQILTVHIENTPLAFIEWDSQIRLIRWTKRAEEIFGWSGDELIGKNPLEWKFIVEEDLPYVQKVMGELQSPNSKSNVCINRNFKKNGDVLHIEWYNSVVRNAQGEIVSILSLVHDVTEQNRAEAERKALEEHIRQAQKMEAIGRLAGSIAHDFNNLLTVINGCSDLLAVTTATGMRDKELIEEIRNAGEQAVGLTRQLLAFSRKQITAPQILELNRVITDFQKTLGRLIGENIELVLQLDPFLGNIKADPGLMTQLIMNLVVNARDAMPNGGRLFVRTLNSTSGAIVLEVEDTGCGMDELTKSRVFEPFFTTKPVGVGTGIGLSTVFSIVQQSSARIEVESELDRGTLFRIHFPRTGSLAAIVKRPETTDVMVGTGETILLAEDEPLVRNLARRILESCGYTVLCAENGFKAIQIFEEYRGEIQLLLTDVMMPEMNGRELAERLIKKQPSLKIVFMSGYTTDDVLRQGIREEQVQFVQKPFTPDVLANKVRLVLDVPHNEPTMNA